MANPTLLEMPIARDGAKNSIPSTTSPTTGLLSQQYGWQDINSMPVQQGGKAPSRLDFNGVLNLLSNILFYAQKGWQFEWDSSQAYYAGCIVKDPSDNKMYMCLNDIISITAPHSDTTNWKLWDLSMLANYLPLSGGALKGNAPIYNDTDDRSLFLAGGTLAEWGSFLQLDGKTHSVNQGPFAVLSCRSDQTNNQYVLRIGGRDGVLQWGPYSGVGNYNDLGGSAIVASNLGTNGYVKNAKGLIIQWGREPLSSFTDGTVGSSKTVALPISFTTSGAISVGGAQSVTNGRTNDGVWTYVSGTSNIALSTTMKHDALDIYIGWMAIGY